jgi:hypothetical protein
MLVNRTVSSLLALALAAAPAMAQQDPGGEAARRAESLDRILGSNAELPKPEVAPAPPFAWLPLPDWLAGQPYRQQPLFAPVPVGGTVRGRVRGSGAP